MLLEIGEDKTEKSIGPLQIPLTHMAGHVKGAYNWRRFEIR